MPFFCNVHLLNAVCMRPGLAICPLNDGCSFSCNLFLLKAATLLNNFTSNQTYRMNSIYCNFPCLIFNSFYLKCHVFLRSLTKVFSIFNRYRVRFVVHCSI